MKINTAVEIGTNDIFCFECGYLRNGGAFCELFRERIEQDFNGTPFRRTSCIAAENAPPMLFK